MTNLLKSFLVIAGIVTLCESGIIDHIKKCDVKDMECQKEVYYGTILEICKTGIPELGIPKLSPLEIKNVTVSLLGMLDIVMEEGIVENMHTCKFEKYKTDFAKGVTYLDIFCDKFTIQGHYNLVPSLIMTQLLGNFVKGNGKAKVDMDKIRMNVVFAFYAEKRDDGEVYLVPDIEKTTYKYDIEGVVFEADNVVLDDQEISPTVISFINQNWRYLFRTFGKYFTDTGSKIFFDYIKKFFAAVPVSKYLDGDLSIYVKS